MPFITPFRRDMVAIEGPANAGELCYLLYAQCVAYLDGARAFNRYAEVLGAISALQACFLHDHVLPYEMEKKSENGDVSP